MSTPTVIQACAALYGVVPSASFVSTINDEITNVFAGDEDALLNHYYELVWTVFNNPPLTTSAVAARIVANLGVTGDDAATETTRIAGEIDSVPMNERGAKVKAIIEAFEASGSEVAAQFTALKTALVTAVANPSYEGISGKNVVFSSLKASNIALATDEAINEVTLTTAADTVTGTSGIDYITGVASSLSAERTMGVTDVIDGGEGEDTLSVTLDGSFAGLTANVGSVTGVENLVLTNNSVIARSFDGSSVTGLTDVTLNVVGGGAISLANMAETGISVGVSGQASGDLTVGFGTTTATDDALTVVALGGIGSTSAVAVQAAGVETLTLKSLGAANKLSVGSSSTGVKTVAVEGDGNLTLTRNAAASAITSVDASAATGTLSFTGGTTGGITSVKGSQGANTISVTATDSKLATLEGGAGNDGMTVDSSTLRADATVQGGDGTDSLTLTSGGARTLQLTMDSVEKVVVGGLTGAITLDGSKVSGLSDVEVGAISYNVTLANVAEADIGLAIKTAASNSSAAVVASDNTGSLTATVSSSATANVTNNLKVTASKAGTATLSVGTGVNYTGTFTATEATSVSINSDTASTTVVSGIGVTSGTGATISAPKAEMFTVTSGAQLNATISAPVATSGTVTHTGTSDATLVLTTPKMEQLTATASKALTLTSSDFSVLQIASLTSGSGTLTVPNLGKIITLNVNGTGTTSGSESTLGFGTLTSEALDLTVSGFKGGGTIGAISSTGSASINLDAAATPKTSGVIALGTISSTSGGVTLQANGATTPVVTSGAITASSGTVTIDISSAGSGSYIGNQTMASNDITAKSVNYTGPYTSASSLDVTAGASGAFSVQINGGLAADTFYVNGIAGTSSITVSGDLSISDAGTYDRVFVIPAASSSATAVTIDVSGLSGSVTGAHVVIGATDGSYPNSGKPLTVVGSGLRDFINVPDDAKSTLTGGAGADTFHFPDSTAFALSAASYTTASAPTYTLSTTARVVITDYNAGADLLAFAGQAAGTDTTIFTTTAPTATTFAADSTGALISDASRAYFIPGSYNSSTGVFTYSSSGTSTLFAFQDDSGTNNYAAVLENYVHATTKQDSTDAVTISPIVVGSTGEAAFTGILGTA